MTRTRLLLATILALSLGLAPRAAPAQQENAASQGGSRSETTGSVGPSVAEPMDQPTPDEIRRLRRQQEEDQAQVALPPPEVITPEIDIFVPAPDAFQEP